MFISFGCRVQNISDSIGAGQVGAREGGGEELHHGDCRGGTVRQDGLHSWGPRLYTQRHQVQPQHAGRVVGLQGERIARAYQISSECIVIKK